jgi:hypothetical protein
MVKSALASKSPKTNLWGFLFVFIFLYH